MFMEKLEKNQKKETENGAIGYKTSGSKLVDLNFGIPSYRKNIDKDLFLQALHENQNLALRWLLYLRDIDFGVGERKSFREFLLVLIKENPVLALKFFKLVPIENFGRWDDIVFVAYKTTNREVSDFLTQKIFNQLLVDLQGVDNNLPISLCAKWMPSINASSNETRRMAKFFQKRFMLSVSAYRKMLSRLRAYLEVLETRISKNDWDKVDYSRVPSKANILYRDAFMRHDSERREKYLKELSKGNTKINAQSMFLYDIVHAYFKNMPNMHYSFENKYNLHYVDSTLEELWKAQVKPDNFKNTLVVRDGSGSMTCTLSNSSSVTALDVADSISLYCAENNSGEFKNKFITFSRNAKLVDVSNCHTLAEKLVELRKHDECENTNIENVFNLILDTAVRNNLRQEDLPANVLIISDMEFDMATCDYFSSHSKKVTSTLFDKISDKYDEYGYKLPKLIFWNVNSRTNTVPITENHCGVILISGFSKSLVNMVMSSEIDPYKALVSELMKPRYDIIDKLD